MITQEKDFYFVNDSFDDERFISDVKKLFNDHDARIILDEKKGLGLIDWYVSGVNQSVVAYDDETLSMVQVNIALEREFGDEQLSLVLELNGVTSLTTTFDVMARPIIDDETNTEEPNFYGYDAVEEWIAQENESNVDFKLRTFGGLIISATATKIGLKHQEPKDASTVG